MKVLRNAIALLLLMAVSVLALRPVEARAFTVEDLLMTEGLGELAVSPDGRWLVFERRVALKGRAQFDDRQQTVARSRLYRVDLAKPGPATPLVPLAKDAGAILFGFSPGGSRAAIARLEKDRWQLGIVTLASGIVRWFPVAPDYWPFRTSLGWTSEDRLVLIARTDGRPAWALDANPKDERDMIAAWATTKQGQRPAVTAVGSGADVGVTPLPPELKLIGVDARTGDIRVFASGRFESLAVSRDGRRVALTEIGVPIRISTPLPITVAAEYRRRRLAIVDLALGTLWHPCPDCDVPSNPPIWSGSGRRLLFYSRTAAVGWRDGRYWLADAAQHSARPLSVVGIRPFIRESPNDYDAVGLAWIDETPTVFAHLGDGDRPDWIALADDGPKLLTGMVDAPSMTVMGASGDPLMVTHASAWRLADMSRTLTTGMTSLRSRPYPIVGDGRARTGMLFGLQNDAAGSLVTLDGASGEKIRPADLEPVSVLATSPEQHAVVGTVTDRHGVIRLRVWRRKDAVTVAELNRHLDDVDVIAPRAIVHRLPDGRQVTSWLILPYRPDRGSPPPLVVIPYAGTQFGDAPPSWAGPGGSRPIDSVAALCGHGYAVLLPSMPKLAASDAPFDFASQVLSAVDAVVAGGWVDAKRMALWGHSYGAYTVAMIASQTDRFGAVIGANGPYDPFEARGVFAPDTRLHPEYFQGIIQTAGWAERGQGNLQATPWSNPKRYMANSVLYRADRIHTPMLILTGDRDFAGLQQSEELFSALYRQGKDAVLLTYWKEGHSLMSPANIRDSYRRIFAWLDAKLGGAGQASAPAAP